MVMLLHQPFPMPGRRRAQAWRHHPAYRRPCHIHDEPELNIVTRGTATFTLGADEHRVGVGAVLWFPPGLDHYLARADDDFDLFVVGYAPDLLAACAREHGTLPTFARPRMQLPAATLELWAELLGQAPNSADDHAVESRLLDLLRSLAAPAPNAAIGPSRELGYRAVSVLIETPEATRDQLARRLASNRGDVSRRFRQQQGLSLCDYRNRLRILRFLSRIEGGHENLTRAALAAGFGSYAQCHRVFRTLLGASPRDYLQREHREALANSFEPLPEASLSVD